MSDIEKAESKQNLTGVIFAGILSIFFDKIPFASSILFPFSMFVTYLHESSHGLAAILTGGALVSFTMEMDTSGLAHTQGGIRFLILIAGYLGTTIWGALLITASIKKVKGKIILSSLSLFFLLFTLLFARNLVSFSMGLFFALSMFVLSKIKNNTVISLFLAFLAVQTCFNSIDDIYDLIFLSNTNIVTDAHLLSKEFTYGFIPPIVFALFLSFISASIFAFTIKKLSNTKK